MTTLTPMQQEFMKIQVKIVKIQVHLTKLNLLLVTLTDIRLQKLHFYSKSTYILVGSDICPVSTFELYLSKLNPEVDFLWQCPKLKISDVTKEWYDAAPVGCDPLNAHMKTLSQNAKLSKIYTNHCIRATVITKLDEKGFEARDIMATTGHKLESSIRSYAKNCPPQKHCNISDALAEPLVENQPKRKATFVNNYHCTSRLVNKLKSK